MWVLIIISALLCVLGFAKGWNDSSVDTLLNWSYIMVFLAIAIVIIVGLLIGFANDPKGIIKLLIGLAILAVICFVVYLIAPGSPLVGSNAVATPGQLKLTDTMLYLSYFAGILAIAAIIYSEIRNAIKNK